MAILDDDIGLDDLQEYLLVKGPGVLSALGDKAITPEFLGGLMGEEKVLENRIAFRMNGRWAYLSVRLRLEGPPKPEEDPGV